MNEDVFGEPQNIFEKRISEMFASKPKNEVDALLSRVTMIVAESAPSDDMIALYHLLSLEDFVRVVNLFDGRMVKFFARKDVQEAFVLALCYYYKEVEGLTWDAIRDRLPFQVSAVSYGSKIKKLSSSMRDKLIAYFSEAKREG